MKPIKLLYILFMASGTVFAQNQLGNTISVEGGPGSQWFGKKVELSDSKHLSVLSAENTIVYNYRLDNSGQWILYDSIQNAVTFSSPDSSTIAVGYSGGAQVFDRVNDEWVQRGPNIGWVGVEQIKMDTKNCLIMRRANQGRVMEWNGTEWVQKGLAYSGALNSIDILGDSIIAIGNCLSSSSNLTNNGGVAVFKWSGGAWSQLGNLIAGTSAGEFLGWSLSLGPNHTIAIGANDPNIFTSGGNKVRIFKLDGTSWQQKGSDLTFTSTSKYGWDVSMGSENVVAIGDRHYGDSFSPQQYAKGFVSIRKWDGNEWVTLAAFEGDSAFSGAGQSVHMLNENTFAFSSSCYIPWMSVISPVYNVDIYSFCQSVATTDVVESCFEYTWIDGNTYTSNNNAAQIILTTQDGCDSIVTLDLTIKQVDTVVNNEGWFLESAATAATFQWINCSTIEIIPEATSNYFIPAENGSYAVVVTQNGCTDTSSCYQINNVGMERLNGMEASVFPNPSSNNITIQCPGEFDFKVLSIDGKTVLSGSGLDAVTCELAEFPRGQYTIVVSQAGKANQYKVILN